MQLSINPATGEEFAQFPELGPDDIDRALSAASKAQSSWRRVPIQERVALLRRLAGLLRADVTRLARLITDEMGKPIVEAAAEIEKCAINCEFYADNAPLFLQDQTVASRASHSAVVFDPLGVILAIMPWNYPFWQLFRFAAPALAAGNGIILKPAANVPGCALAIENIMKAAGCPDGLFRTLLIGTEHVAGLIGDDRIAAITMTGSTEVGSIVAAQAGKALKKQVLELGGSDPFIVLADADLELAASVAVKSRFTNAGQSCVNAKRFIVEDVVADRFVELFIEAAGKLNVGQPADANVQIGPLARANLRTTLHEQVRRSMHAGAALKMGGQLEPGPGFFYRPTVLDHVKPGMAAFDEETFGPVAAIVRARDVEDAIALANRTEFGLGAALWTSDLARAQKLARRLDAGAVFINGMVASDPRLPFGGIKKSGYGRELGDYGIREFVNIKTIWLGPAKE